VDDGRARARRHHRRRHAGRVTRAAEKERKNEGEKNVECCHCGGGLGFAPTSPAEASADIALHGATSATCTAAAGKVAGNAVKLSVGDATLGVREIAQSSKSGCASIL
jgi:hypothetical protein